MCGIVYQTPLASVNRKTLHFPNTGKQVRPYFQCLEIPGGYFAEYLRVAAEEDAELHVGLAHVGCGDFLAYLP